VLSQLPSPLGMRGIGSVNAATTRKIRGIKQLYFIVVVIESLNGFLMCCLCVFVLIFDVELDSSERGRIVK
jgi:hypothetical protein